VEFLCAPWPELEIDHRADAMLLILEAAGMIEVSNLAVTFHAQRHAVGEPVLHLPFGLERGDVAGIEIVDEKCVERGGDVMA
jgi:hypothetical protein